MPRTSKRRTQGSSEVGDFLAFRKMIVPIIIQVIFWLGVAGIVLSSLNLLMGRLAVEVYLGIALLIMGPIYWRIVCEMMIVAFRILDVLTEIKNSLNSRK